jgi:hypothetical protein
MSALMALPILSLPLNTKKVGIYTYAYRLAKVHEGYSDQTSWTYDADVDHLPNLLIVVDIDVVKPDTLVHVGKHLEDRRDEVGGPERLFPESDYDRCVKPNLQLVGRDRSGMRHNA